jgi:hypothetical protein
VVFETGTTKARHAVHVVALRSRFLLRLTGRICFAASRRLGLRKTAVGLTPFVRFFSGTFFVRWNCYAIPLSRTKNVIYARNVKRNKNLNWFGRAAASVPPQDRNILGF